MKIQKYRFLGLLTALGLLGINPQAQAQQDGRTHLDAAMEREVTIIKDTHSSDYQQPTLENLSTLYWKLHAFDLSDNRAVDNYMIINECEIYKNYFHDDIEWVNIRDVARKKIKSDAEKAGTQFQFLLPIFLGPYDTERGGFDIVNNSGFPDLKRIEFLSAEDRKKNCLGQTETQDYNKDILLIFEKPLNYMFLKLDDHIAQAYILRQNQIYTTMSENLRQDRILRKAYVRLRMNIKQYQGTIDRTAVGEMAILFGQIEGLEVFEDEELKLLLQSYNYIDGVLVPSNVNVSADE